MDQASRIAFYLLLLAALTLIGWSTRERNARRRSGVPAGGLPADGVPGDSRRSSRRADEAEAPGAAAGAARETRNPSRIFPAGSVRRVG
jgi:hypothetical protein